MSRGAMVEGLGRGAMQGMELYRRHSREDEQLDRQREMDELRRRQAELGMESTRQQMDFRGEAQPLKLEGMRQGVESGRRNARSEEARLEAEEIASDARTAVRALLAGDLPAVQGWYKSIAPNEMHIEEAGADEQTGQPLYHLSYSEGDEEVVPQQELLRRIGELSNPDAVMESALAGSEPGYSDILYDEDLGYGQLGPDRQWNPIDAQGRGGAGSEDWSPQHGPYKTSDYNHMAGEMARRFGGGVDEEGNIFVPEGNRERHAAAYEAAGNLMRMGHPLPSAVSIGAGVGTADMTRPEAEQMAREEAAEQGVPRREREAYVRERAPEIFNEAHQARQVYDQLLQQGPQGMPGRGQRQPGVVQPQPRGMGGRAGEPEPERPRSQGAPGGPGSLDETGRRNLDTAVQLLQDGRDAGEVLQMLRDRDPVAADTLEQILQSRPETEPPQGGPMPGPREEATETGMPAGGGPVDVPAPDIVEEPTENDEVAEAGMPVRGTDRRPLPREEAEAMGRRGVRGFRTALNQGREPSRAVLEAAVYGRDALEEGERAQLDELLEKHNIEPTATTHDDIANRVFQRQVEAGQVPIRMVVERVNPDSLSEDMQGQYRALAERYGIEVDAPLLAEFRESASAGEPPSVEQMIAAEENRDQLTEDELAFLDQWENGMGMAQ